MYVPTLARFISRDPIEPDGIDILYPPPILDPYKYVRNNPGNAVDPSGLSPSLSTLIAPHPKGISPCLPVPKGYFCELTSSRMGPGCKAFETALVCPGVPNPVCVVCSEGTECKGGKKCKPFCVELPEGGSTPVCGCEK